MSGQQTDCALCGLPVVASPDRSKWGFAWERSWVHYHCVDNLYAASLRLRDPRVKTLEMGKQKPCPHCGVLPGEVHGVNCPLLPKGMFGSLTPEISTGFSFSSSEEPPWFTKRLDRIEDILFGRITRRGP